MKGNEGVGREPAFPVELVTDYSNDSNAHPIRTAYADLTKREAFALAAMQGMAMRSRGILDHEVAGAAVRLADALLAELAKDPQP